MNDYQTLFDGIVSLLKKNSVTDSLAKQCLNDCELELAFTPPKKNTAVTKNVLLEIYKRTDTEALAQVSPSFSKSNINEVIIWYLDTENGGYTIYTDSACTELVGIKTSTKTLAYIRNGFFAQQDALKKLGDKPAFEYDKKEVTFMNKKLIE